MDKSCSNWQDGKTVLECNEYMLSNQIHCDVTFKVGTEEREIRAHKYVMASRSSVFCAMLFGSLSENTDVIVVPDIEHGVFEVLLRFLYYEETDIDEGNVTGILYAADKYAVADLIAACNSYLKTQIGVESVCTIMENAKLFHLNDLFTKCTEFIVQSDTISKRVLESEGFLQNSRDIVRSVIELDELLVNEECIYRSLICWARKACEREGKDQTVSENIRSKLGDILHRIRFPVMSLEAFWKEVAYDNVLSLEEKDQISRVIVGKSDTCALPFPKGRRGKNITVYRGKKYQPTWKLTGNVDALRFKVNKALFLRGLVLLGSSDKHSTPFTYTVEIKIINNDNQNVLHYPEQSITSSGSEFQIVFDSLCSIQANQMYTIWMNMCGPDSLQARECVCEVKEMDFQFNFFKSEMCNNGTDTSHGQIPGLLCVFPQQKYLY